jgi:hypothetical protein
MSQPMINRYVTESAQIQILIYHLGAVDAHRLYLAYPVIFLNSFNHERRILDEIACIDFV